MSWEMHDKEFDSVISLPGKHRYAYFIKKLADWEEVWSLWSEDGWVLAGDNQGHELVPVWPHERFASACISDDWAGCVPKVIPLRVWMDRWIPGMIRDRRLVSVFRTPSGESVLVSPERLIEDLEKEISLYE